MVTNYKGTYALDSHLFTINEIDYKVGGVTGNKPFEWECELIDLTNGTRTTVKHQELCMRIVKHKAEKIKTKRTDEQKYSII